MNGFTPNNNTERDPACFRKLSENVIKAETGFLWEQSFYVFLH